MFAIVRTGGKQYRVAAGDKIVVEKLDGEAGSTVTLGDVLLAGEGGELKSTEGLTVSAEIVAQAKGEKVIVFKKRRRHNYRRKNGHRCAGREEEGRAEGEEGRRCRGRDPGCGSVSQRYEEYRAWHIRRQAALRVTVVIRPAVVSA